MAGKDQNQATRVSYQNDEILNIKFSIKISEWLCRDALKLTQSLSLSLSLSLSG